MFLVFQKVSCWSVVLRNSNKSGSQPSCLCLWIVSRKTHTNIPIKCFILCKGMQTHWPAVMGPVMVKNVWASMKSKSSKSTSNNFRRGTMEAKRKNLPSETSVQWIKNPLTQTSRGCQAWHQKLVLKLHHAQVRHQKVLMTALRFRDLVLNQGK
jgi:hypothetical protein